MNLRGWNTGVVGEGRGRGRNDTNTVFMNKIFFKNLIKFFCKKRRKSSANELRT